MTNFFSKEKLSLTRFSLLTLILFSFLQKTSAQTQFVKNDNANPLQRFAVASCRQSHPAFVDIDGDGDMDCFSGEFNYSKNGVVCSHVLFLKNEGDAKHSSFNEIKGASNPLQAIAISGLVIPQFADIDADGDQDCFIANNNGAITFYENKGTAKEAKFEKQSAAFNPLSGVKFSTVAISNFVLNDLDADGDIDCLVVDADGNEAYYKNNGSVYQSSFVSVEKNSPFSFINQTAVNTISSYDWNKDGKMDMFVNNKYYQNSWGQFSTGSVAPSLNNNAAVATSFVDLNNDGTPEIIGGTSDGKFTYNTVANVTTKAITFIKVSPNPATKNFTIYLPFSTDKRSLKITNETGKVVMLQTINASSYTFGDAFASGTYFVQILSAGNKIGEQKIVKL